MTPTKTAPISPLHNHNLSLSLSLSYTHTPLKGFYARSRVPFLISRSWPCLRCLRPSANKLSFAQMRSYGWVLRRFDLQQNFFRGEKNVEKLKFFKNYFLIPNRLQIFSMMFQIFFCSTSPPGGNQVDGLPPVLSGDIKSEDNSKFDSLN